MPGFIRISVPKHDVDAMAQVNRALKGYNGLRENWDSEAESRTIVQNIQSRRFRGAMKALVESGRVVCKELPQGNNDNKRVRRPAHQKTEQMQVVVQGTHVFQHFAYA